MPKFNFRKKKKEVVKSVKRIAKRKYPMSFPLMVDFLATRGIDFLDEKVKSSGERFSAGKINEVNKKSKHRPRFSFRMPHAVDKGKFESVVFENKNVESPVVLDFTRTTGKTNRYFKNLKKQFPSVKIPIRSNWKNENLFRNKSWDNYSCVGFNRKGVQTINVAHNVENPRVPAIWDGCGTTEDKLLALVDVFEGAFVDVQELRSNFRSAIPVGSDDILVPIESIEQNYTYMNGNEFLPLYVQVYVCTPHEDLPQFSLNHRKTNHPLNCWFDPQKAGQQVTSTLERTKAGDEMDYAYSYLPVWDTGDASIESSHRIIETSVVFGATPFYSSEFKEKWDVVHVYKIKLLPQQRLELNLKLEFNDFHSLQSLTAMQNYFTKQTTLFPLVTFYGESVIATDLSRVSSSPMDKVLEGSGPGILFNESRKIARVIASPHLRNLSSSAEKVEFPAGTLTKSKELLDLDDTRNTPYANINTFAQMFKNPYETSYREGAATTPCTKDMEIKTTSETAIKEVGSIASREV